MTEKESKDFKGINLKFLLFSISLRRNFIPILSIYFLTLDNTTANQIGIFTGIGFIATLLFEVPSGYLSDVFGHKKTLVLAKISQSLSVLFYMLGYFLDSPYNFYIFIFASIFQTIGYAFFSGTKSAFYHDILEDHGKEKDFAKLEGKLSGNASLISVLIIFLLPLSIIIHILAPFIISLFIDIIGIFLLLSISNPKIEHTISNNTKHKSFLTIFNEAKFSGLLNISLFLGIINGYTLGEAPFRYPFIEQLGFPVVFIGIVMGGSRFFRFVFGHTIHHIEKYLNLKQLFIIEIILFTIFYIIMSIINNPYILGLWISVIVGYKWGRLSLINSYILKNYIEDKRYKATFFSITSMFDSVFGFFVTTILGYFIAIYGYKLNYFYLGVSIFILLSISYYFTFIKKRES